MKRTLLFCVLSIVVVVLWLLVRETPALQVPDSGVLVEAGSAAQTSETGVTDAAVRTRSDQPRAGLAQLTGRSLIRGRLQRSDGVDMAGISLALRSTRADGIVLAKVETGDSGGFVFTTVPTGTYRITAADVLVPSGFKIGPLKIPDGQIRDLGVIQVAVAATVRGRVVNESGRPLQGVTVYHSLADEHGFQKFSRFERSQDPTSVTDTSGRFSFTRVPPGEVRVLVEVTGMRDTVESAKVASGSVAQLGDLILRKGRAIRGTVRDRNGQPLQGVRVTQVNWLDRLERKATTSQRDGTFVLAGVGAVFEKLVFEKDQHIPEEVSSYDIDGRHGKQPKRTVDVVLEPMLTLRGVVRGCRGARTTIKIDFDVRDNEKMPNSCIYRQEWKAHAVDDQGRFAIPGLTPGVYGLVATAKGVGASRPTKVKLDHDLAARKTVAELVVVPYDRVLVQVTDQAGRRLSAATVCADFVMHRYKQFGGQAMCERTIGRILANRSGLPSFRSDDSGQVSVVINRTKPVALGVSCDGYLPTGVSFLQGGVPERLIFKLTKATRICGVVEGLPRVRPYRVEVSMRLESGSAPPVHTTVAVDSTGRFASGPLVPGRWRVALARHDVTGQSDEVRRGFGTLVPVVGEPIDLRTSQVVAAAAGATAEVRLRCEPTGQLRGRVMCQGRAVANATVWMVPEGTKINKDLFGLTTHDTWDSFDAYRRLPHVTTGSDGRYCFVFQATGKFDLRARSRGSAASAPILVQLRQAGEQIYRDIELPGATLTGRFVLPASSGRTKPSYQACLYRLADAGEDPYFCTDYVSAQRSCVVKQELAPNGAFAFHHLPADRWVLRIASRWSSTLAQRVVTTNGTGSVDLGDLSSTRANVSLQCVLPKLPEGRWGAWVRSVGSGRLVHVDTVYLAAKTSLRLAPGRYELELMEAYRNWNIPMSSFAGKSTGRKRRFVVDAEGRCEPTKLDFSKER